MTYGEFKAKLMKHMDNCLPDYDSDTFEDWLQDLAGVIDDLLEDEQ